MNQVGLAVANHNWQINLRDEADESVFNEIFKFKEYRRAEDVIREATYPIVDVGAHVGFFSIYCRSLNRKAKIFAIEPEQNNLKALNNHLKINKIKGIKVVAGCLAQESGTRELLLAADSHNHRLGPDFEKDDDSIEVEASSFSDFYKQHRIKKISLLKMDIEGGEYEVFDSMSDRDFAMVNYIILEYHNGKEKSKELEEKLRENGFAVQTFPSKFDKTMGYIFAHNKRF